MNTIHRIEHPKTGQEDAQIAEIVSFMVAHDQVVQNPIIFLHGWHSGKIKVFTRRDAGHISGMQIVSIIEDPVTGEAHKITNFTGGLNISRFVDEALSIYM